MIVSSAWPLVTALLRKDPNALGIAYCAVGEGDPAWDTKPPQPGVETTRLHREIARVPLGPADMRYIDASGRSTQTWTHRLEVTVIVPPVTTARKVREFGLFGGDAGAAANTGRLINYAVHPVIELRANQTLTRTIRLSFRPGGSSIPEQAGGVPLHWLGGEPTTLVDGVGDAVASALKEAGVTNIRQLAALALEPLPKGLSRSRAIELKAKAQLALQAATQLVRISSLSGATLDDVIAATPDLTTPADLLDRLQAQIGLLQVALDARWLRKRTMGELLASRAP